MYSVSDMLLGNVSVSGSVTATGTPPLRMAVMLARLAAVRVALRSALQGGFMARFIDSSSKMSTALSFAIFLSLSAGCAGHFILLGLRLFFDCSYHVAHRQFATHP